MTGDPWGWPDNTLDLAWVGGMCLLGLVTCTCLLLHTVYGVITADRDFR